jgi:pyruvate,orthophosphate dikinase
VRHFEGEETDQPVVEAVARLMEHADAKRRLRVRTNADTGEDALRARRFGAQGIGLCRTEHMFLGERRQLVENLIVAEDEAEQDAALAELLVLQRQDFLKIFEAMDGLPVTIRLIDPPLHEFLPDITELSVAMAVADVRGQRKKRQRTLLAAVQRLHESNPMLGLRGVRLGIVIPGLFTMQARAILEAAAQHIREGGHAEPEIMIPLVASVRELDLVKGRIVELAHDVEGVGALVRRAATDGRAANADLHLGVCGEHGGDPASIHFFDEVGLDYVSCSPFRVPVARLEAGRAAMEAEGS